MPFIEHNDKRLLYIHVPKTGGTTIEAWMQTIAPLRMHTIGLPSPLRCTPQHLRHQDLRLLFGEDYFDQAFMTVRNPFDRIASEYRMRAHLASEGFWKGFPRFSNWLETTLTQQTKNSYVADNHMRPQWEFLGDGVEVFRLEDGMDTILTTVAQKFGTTPPTKVEQALSTDKTKYKVTWTRPDILRVQEAYAQDFTEFGYSPDPG